MINFYFILLKKSRLFRYLMKRYPSLAAFTGLGLTQLRVLPNESSVLSPAIQSGLGKLSAHTFLTDTILAPGSQPDSKSVTVGHPSREHREPRENKATRSRVTRVTVSTTRRNVLRDGRRVTVLVSSSPHRLWSATTACHPP